MAGKLYLCATPIGNLEDITMRVLRTLQEVDLIAAEDTRNSMKLLNHFEIKTPMTSYHEYNRIEKAHVLIAKMQEGTNIALITDAGTPGISDPGEDLVRLCYEAGIEVTSLPGACACVTALTLSGLGTRRFCFEAFLPMEKKERQEILNERLSVPEAFLAIDGILDLYLNVVDGLVVYPKVIEKHMMAELPFMATENIMMDAVKAGGDRQELHERIRTLSMEAGRNVKVEGKDNNLLELIAADPAFNMSLEDLKKSMDPSKYVGRAPLQVENFLKNVVNPVLEANKEILGMKAEINV